ncbi:MAG: hypothetical protein RLZZ598_29 [Pseudomonadota bacterium]|jgi:serine/threonine-protein kinase RsbW
MDCIAAPAGTVLDERIDATLDEVSRVCAAMSTALRASVDDEWIAAWDLGVTEALTNVVRHGYLGAPGQFIDVRCEYDGPFLQVRLSDQGRRIPASLWEAATGDVFDFDPDDLQSVPEGGMGLSLIRACFDESSYVGDGSTNHLVLRKRLPACAA